jgi:hypothetical protein
MDRTSDIRGVTRRSLLQTGGGAALVALIGVGPWSAAKALAAESAPAYLRRSSYLPLVGDTFRTGSQTVRLDQVDGDREDMFGLVFSGALLAQGVHRLSHPQLGTFALFIAPVGAVGDQQVVIDRSVKLRTALDAAPAPAPPPPAAASPAGKPEVPTAALPHGSAHRPLVRHAAMRRVAHGVRCDLTLRHSVKRVELRLLRSGRTVAKGHRKLHARHVTMRLATRYRLPAGEYELLVVTTDLKGRATSQVVTVGIR